MNGRALNMLGLCARARKLITGEKAVVQAIRDGDVCVAVLDGAASKNAEKALGDACKTHGVPLLRTAPMALGGAVGRPGRMAAGVIDEGMGRRIVELCQTEEG